MYGFAKVVVFKYANTIEGQEGGDYAYRNHFYCERDVLVGCGHELE
jgi:hypothetical protein